MKKFNHLIPAGFFLKAFFAVQMLMFSVMSVMAQDGDGKADVNVDINKGGDGAGAWYTNWWIWVVVGLILIILIVAMTRRPSNTTINNPPSNPQA